MLWERHLFFLYCMCQVAKFVKILPNIFSCWYAWGLEARQESPNTDPIHTGKKSVHCFDHSSAPFGNLVGKWRVNVTANKRDLLSAERRMIWNNHSCMHTNGFVMLFIIQNYCSAKMSLSPLPCFWSCVLFASMFPCENKDQYFVELEGRGKRRKDGAWKKIIWDFHRFHFK